MKTIKTLFAILFLTTMFIACEAESVNEEVGVEVEDRFGTEDADTGEVEPSSTVSNKG